MHERLRMLAMHGRVMVRMYQLTRNRVYLERAKADLWKAKCIRNGGFVRPMGVLL